MNQNIIEIQGVSKVYGDNTVLDNLSLNIRKNEFLTLLGPSGCGKTTTLKIIAGFETADSGKVIFNGSDISNIPPYKRQLNTVFQKYALFPHMNIYENIAFGLKIKKLPKDEIDKKVREMLKMVSLEGFEKRSVDSLSGGQQQRVAIARALVNEPKVLLLDEPLGALDLKLRKEMQLELKKIQKRLGITFIFVTHDQEEALTMSDTIVVMNKGKIQQMGSPEDIYNEPANACVDGGFNKNEDIDVVIRPEDIEITTPDKGMLTGKVNSVIFKGVHYEMEVITEDTTWIVHNIKHAEAGKIVGLIIDPESIHIMRKVKGYEKEK